MANPSNTKIAEDPNTGVQIKLKLTDMYLQYGGNVEVIITQNAGTENERSFPVMRKRKAIDFNGVTLTEDDIMTLVGRSDLFKRLIPELLEDIAKEYTE